MEKVNAKDYIVRKKYEIECRIRKSFLTNEQLEKGYKLMQIENKVLEMNNDRLYDWRGFAGEEVKFLDAIYKCETRAQHTITKIFSEMLSMLDFDGKEAIEIQRDKEELSIFEEVGEFGGEIVEVDHEVNKSWHAISYHGEYYTWDSYDRRIQCKELDEIPDYIKEFLSK